MIPLALCSILALTIALERIVNLSKSRVIPGNFLKELKEHMKECHESEIEGAVTLCKKQHSALGNMFTAGLLKLEVERRFGEIEKTISDSGAREIGKMKRSLKPLRVIAGVSPLLGLLGTVTGMIKAFQTVAASGGNLDRAERLAQGIYEAMVTTATGLSIAIPTLLVFFFLSNRIEFFADEMEIACDEFLNHWLKCKLDNKPDQGRLS